MSLIISAKEFGNGVARVYRRYAEWLVSITWKRFILLSILLMILAGVLSGIPPFSWDLTTRTSKVPASRNVDISVDENGVRIKPRKKSSTAPEITIDENGIRIKRHGDAASGTPAQEIIVDDIRREVIDEVRREVAQVQLEAAEARRQAAEARRRALEEARSAAEEAQREADQARRDAEQAKRDADNLRKELQQDLGPLAADIRREVSDAIAEMGDTEHVVHIRLGNYLPQLAFLFILLSAAIKIAHSGRVKAEAKAAEAQEVADEESLKRQVVEARMAAMQAQ